jgi:hypothetical protein
MKTQKTQTTTTSAWLVIAASGVLISRQTTEEGARNVRKEWAASGVVCHIQYCD